MPIILEDESGKLSGRRVIVPKEVSDAIQKQLNLYGNKVKASKGYKRAKTLTSDEYNNRSRNGVSSTEDGRKIVSFSDLKRIDHEMRHMSQNPNNLQYAIQGGDVTRNWVDSELGRLRGSVKDVGEVKPVPKLEKNKIIPNKPNKPQKLGNANVTLK